jgi:tRNA isopentenyl-2-thiomethyl-A-37 hydroxylase MiaE
MQAAIKGKQKSDFLDNMVGWSHFPAGRCERFAQLDAEFSADTTTIYRPGQAQVRSTVARQL